MKFWRNGDLILRQTIVRYSAREFSRIPYKFARGDCFFRSLFSEKKKKNTSGVTFLDLWAVSAVFQ